MAAKVVPSGSRGRLVAGARLGASDRVRRLNRRRPESSDYHRAAMTDQLSLRLEPALPNLPSTLRPMLARPLPEPFDSPDHLFEPVWGGLRALALIGPAEMAGAGDVSFVGEDGRRSSPSRRISRAWRCASRLARRCSMARSWSSIRAGAWTRTSSRGGFVASRAGRSPTSPSTSSTSTADRS